LIIVSVEIAEGSIGIAIVIHHHQKI